MDTKKQQHFFEEIIAHNKGILFKVAHSYCKDLESQQDLIQEIMIQIWQSLPKYNNQYKMSTWIYRIALNVAISAYRKNTRKSKLFTPLNNQLAEQLAESQATNNTQLKLLEQFISELKELDKALMILYLEDKSHSEIADIMGISVSNVGTKIGRIKTQLKHKFTQLK